METWTKSVPKEITGDRLWNVEAYRLALYVADLGWHDATRLMQDRRTIRVSDQLYRAIGSISANIAEGFSRNSPKERAHYYEYALGSARESRGWYYKGRHVLGEELARERIKLVTQIVRLLLTMVPEQRASVVREDSTDYVIAEQPVE